MWLIILVIILILGTFFCEDGVIAALWWLMGGLIGGFVVFAIAFGATSHQANHFQSEQTYTLKALSSSSKVEGRFFLGGGYVDGVRTLNYITETNGQSS